MTLQEKTLEDWFLEKAKGNLAAFPHGDDCHKKYSDISETLHKWVHPEVEKGAMINDGARPDQTPKAAHPRATAPPNLRLYRP